MEEKGFLSKSDERWLSRVLDHVCELKGWLEIVDGPSFKLLIKVADDYVVENYLPVEQKNLLKELVILGKAKNIEGIKTEINNFFKITNPILLTIEGVALSFVLKAVYEWADDISSKINNN